MVGAGRPWHPPPGLPLPGHVGGRRRCRGGAVSRHHRRRSAALRRRRRRSLLHPLHPRLPHAPQRPRGIHRLRGRAEALPPQPRRLLRGYLRAGDRGPPQRQLHDPAGRNVLPHRLWPLPRQHKVSVRHPARALGLCSHARHGRGARRARRSHVQAVPGPCAGRTGRLALPRRRNGNPLLASHWSGDARASGARRCLLRS
mmetsp:Transcript_26174/g.98534  ORF Transcript_26174/g.98534 Transcript_26174/m.98534 type:complete len:200 (+) Transcript_26174:737-1336(+)